MYRGLLASTRHSVVLSDERNGSVEAARSEIANKRLHNAFPCQTNTRLLHGGYVPLLVRNGKRLAEKRQNMNIRR